MPEWLVSFLASMERARKLWLFAGAAKKLEHSLCIMHKFLVCFLELGLGPTSHSEFLYLKKSLGPKLRLRAKVDFRMTIAVDFKPVPPAR